MYYLSLFPNVKYFQKMKISRIGWKYFLNPDPIISKQLPQRRQQPMAIGISRADNRIGEKIRSQCGHLEGFCNDAVLDAAPDGVASW